MNTKLLRLVLTTAALLPAADRVTYTETVAPILFENCVGCHRPGEAAPFSLLSYDDARRRGALIAAVTRSRYMPPWHAAHGVVEFKGERSVDTGNRIPPERTPRRASRFVRLVERRSECEARRRGRMSGIWRNGNYRRCAGKPGGGLGGWAVGGTPRMAPEGAPMFLPKGSDFLLQVHFHLTGKRETEKSLVGIYFASEASRQGNRFCGAAGPLWIRRRDKYSCRRKKLHHPGFVRATG
jgi:hypothetical protein